MHVGYVLYNEDGGVTIVIVIMIMVMMTLVMVSNDKMEINGDESDCEYAGNSNEDKIDNVAKRRLHLEPHHDTRVPYSIHAAPRATDVRMVTMVIVVMMMSVMMMM